MEQLEADKNVSVSTAGSVENLAEIEKKLLICVFKNSTLYFQLHW